MREVFEYTRFWAVGSGREFAIGAMHVLYGRLKTSEAIAKAGVACGATFDNAQPKASAWYVAHAILHRPA